ncbi:ankyrin repeat and MYND domain-containing protein 1-like [Trichoplusia ni]|uniref:Ankyrin repeat and MYND domain-containing protein 1-like n=1 Tax=Trichoplusia ni TaxID=7111 RepID=A0A7E5WFW9_TRINI|nr:ankyrin repeat and MYND domain-containing protein 1-like [Trichoplusia ni]
MPCHGPKTTVEKDWPYDEYYQGERDQDQRKHGHGGNHWTGAESQQSYDGSLLRDTMHGYGDYRWRYIDANHMAFTYEGHYYNNRMHGYGTMSYPDGRVFKGLYYNDVRWGPGVESHACLRADVGLWRGTQLMRLSWRPSAPPIAPDLDTSTHGSNTVAPHRIKLINETKIVGEVNSALDLLKKHGCDPLVAAENWPRLYPKSCTDTNSQLCHVELFDRAYYNNQINTLVEHSGTLPAVSDDSMTKDSLPEDKVYNAWNNNRMIIHMMKHCYQHEEQRAKFKLQLNKIMSGPRSSFKPAGRHELDCRTMLMACFLGHISNVAQLINEFDVNPNVTDLKGNSAMMYAACGDQPEIIHFLLEAGAEIDSQNDVCCTPLGIALLRFTMARWEIPPGSMLAALLPPTHHLPHVAEHAVLEWHIKRDLNPPPAVAPLSKVPSKTLKPLGTKRMASVVPATATKRKSEVKPIPEPVAESRPSAVEDAFSEEKRLYSTINSEYLIRVHDEFASIVPHSSIPNIFEVRDMSKEVDADILMFEDDHRKMPDKNAKRVASKVIKDTLRPSRDMMWQAFDTENDMIDTIEQMKQDKMGRIMLTILQLLEDGADPRKVKCPQPPLLIATVAGCADLIRELVRHGADVNEAFPKSLGYTSLDIAVSGPLTFDNLEVIRSLLESGARTDHRLPIPDGVASGSLEPAVLNVEGPTLLHAIMARKVDFEPEEEVRRNILELLLEHGCDPITQYKGHSAVNMAMLKSMDIFDIVLRSPNTDLNAIINENNQTILVKMFYLPYCKLIPLQEKIQMLTNLLLFGADPLIKCQNGKDEYSNLFVYARKVLSDLESSRKPPSPTGGNAKKAKSEVKPKKDTKTKDTKSAKAVGVARTAADDIADYKQALDLVVECARLLYIRWLQAKLLIELIEIVDKYKHRQWNMILKEHKNKKSTGLWLTALRCLEIWEVLKTTKKKVYNDRILRHLLCIVHFYYKRMWKVLRGWPIVKPSNTMTSQEKALIESEVMAFIHEHKLATMSTPDVMTSRRPYVTPELTVKGTEKFNVCFDCALPLVDDKIPCASCKLISFCSFDCMKANIGRANCHPCSEYLKNKYFPTPEEADTETETDLV